MLRMHCFQWHESESNRQTFHQGLSLAAFPVCVPCQSFRSCLLLSQATKKAPVNVT